MYAVVITFFIFLAGRQQPAYVCTPCGASCDDMVYHAEGACPHCGMKLVLKSSIAFKDLSLDEFCARMRANPNAVVLDVRSSGEFNGTTQDVPTFGHFKRAINISVSELAERIGELETFKDREILVYCSHNHRSPRASYILGSSGFKNVNNMVGGVSTFMDAPEQACLQQEFVFHDH